MPDGLQEVHTERPRPNIRLRQGRRTIFARSELFLSLDPQKTSDSRAGASRTPQQKVGWQAADSISERFRPAPRTGWPVTGQTHDVKPPAPGGSN
jgi:hypothetical protein